MRWRSVGSSVADDAADAGEARLDLARDSGGYGGPAAGVVTEEQHHRRAGQGAEIGAGPGQLLVADGDRDQVVASCGRVRDDADPGLGPAAVQDITGDQLTSRDLAGTRRWLRTETS